MIKVENLTVGLNLLNKQLLLDKLSCFVPAGRITTFIGKSGAGKTTLLRTIAKLNKVEWNGKIEIGGKNIKTLNSTQQAELLGFVFQDFNLFENMTVLENCTQPLGVVKKLSFQVAEEIASEKLLSLGMENFLQSYPQNLSGGQKQRVAIARAICMGSKTLLLDEPTSALDPMNTIMLSTLLRELCARDIAIAVSSQDMNFVKMIMDKIYLIDKGKIVDEFDSLISNIMSKSSKTYNFLNL